MNMNDSRKLLIAQINKVEEELYAERERAIEYKQQISTHKSAYIWGALLLTAIPLIFFGKSRQSLKGVANSAATVGKFALVSYCKKAITDLLEKK